MLVNASFQTPFTDVGPGLLDGTVTGLTVFDPTEDYPPGEKTMLLETDDPFNVQLDWKLSGRGVWVVGG
jgi:hypothetical protein